MSNILGFTTYPVKFPLHGGQRRIAAFAEFYRRLGLNYEAVCIYEPGSYSLDKIGPFDLPLKTLGGTPKHLPFIGDLLSGIYGANDPAVIGHFSKIIQRKMPLAIVLEQPFMWPLLEKIRQDPMLTKIPMIYSSQNWEAPLKFEMLARNGVDRATAREVERQIDELERSATKASQLIFSCSEADAKIYRDVDPEKQVIVIKNGVNRPSKTAGSTGTFPDFSDAPYLFFVGSAYPPNIDGLCDLLLENGLFFMPPQKGFAICGGACDGIFQDPRYQKFLDSNNERVRFFQEISDEELDSLKANAHAILLPIKFGGGSNLKTAEALATGKWVIASPVAMRGFEEFLDAPGVVVADGPKNFRQAVIKALNSPPLELTEAAKEIRESVYWDRRFGNLKWQDFSLM